MLSSKGSTRCVEMVVSRLRLRYRRFCRFSEGRKGGSFSGFGGWFIDRFTLRMWSLGVSVFRCTLKIITWFGGVVSVVVIVWMKRFSSGDRKRSGDMFFSRSVMLCVSISFVMMVTRSAYWVVILCTSFVER